MNQKKFSAEDLATDPDFVRWVKNPASGYGRMWLDWAALSAENEAILKDARKMVLALSDDNDAPFEEELDEVWNRIRFTNAVSDREKPESRRSLSSLIFFRPAIAAAVLIALLGAAAVIWFSNEKEEIHTGYGHCRTIILPDSSVVTLNGNSTIKYASSWHDEKREIWLDGEAFFSVVHKPGSKKFIVHTPDLAIQVTGTKFNVNTYQSRTRVVLNSGKVKLRMNDMVMEMDPGDLVDFSSKTGDIVKKTVDAPKFSSWASRKFIFEDTSLGEIARLLENNYGYRITFSDTSLSSLSFTGRLDADNPDLLLTMIRKSFGLSVISNGKSIAISY